MPLYEYSCSACGHRFEVLQNLGTDGSTLACPGCGARNVRKVLSTFAASSQAQTGGVGGGCGGSGFT